VESTRVRRVVEEQLGIPHLKITTDYSPSDSSRIRTRVEATLECLRRQGGN
jgi:benzoyl-CoA reductase/2-hydroxyglutaryl-CoA dehydratase subunit BcrC/BadD/HgdB